MNDTKFYLAISLGIFWALIAYFVPYAEFFIIGYLVANSVWENSNPEKLE